MSIPPRRILVALALACLLAGCCTPRPAELAGSQRGAAVEWPSATWVPMKVDPSLRVPILLRLNSGATPVTVEAMVDTGSELGVILPPRFAAALGARPSGPPRPARGAAGPVEFTPAGNVDVEIAGVSLVGVPAEIGPTESVILGAEYLSRAGGFVFDWAGKRMGIVTRRIRGDMPPSPAPGGGDGGVWVAAPLFPSAHEDASDPALRTIRIRQLYLRATLDGRSVLAMLDTGDTGELAVPGLADGPADAEIAQCFGNRTVVQRSRQAVPFVIAGDGGLPAFQVHTTWMGKDAKFKPQDVVVGLGVLRRQPVWLDYDGAEARFWRDDRTPAGGRDGRDRALGNPRWREQNARRHE